MYNFDCLIDSTKVKKIIYCFTDVVVTNPLENIPATSPSCVVTNRYYHQRKTMYVFVHILYTLSALLCRMDMKTPFILLARGGALSTLSYPKGYGPRVQLCRNGAIWRVFADQASFHQAWCQLRVAALAFARPNRETVSRTYYNSAGATIFQVPPHANAR